MDFSKIYAYEAVSSNAISNAYVYSLLLFPILNTASGYASDSSLYITIFSSMTLIDLTDCFNRSCLLRGLTLTATYSLRILIG